MSERLKRAALYVRVSTAYQIDKESLPVQREELQNYCQYALGINSFEIFEDAGYSAKNTSRPSYQQMMSRIRSGEFTHLVVWKIDRISRNVMDFTAMYAELKDLHVTFISKNEQFDTSSAIGEAMLKIILVFAELERKMTAERVSAVALSRASDGKWNGGRCPYGYTHEKGTSVFTVNPEEAKIVAWIFQTYSESGTVLSITKELNRQGLKTHYGAWNSNSVWTILTNPFYYGAMRYNYRNESKGMSSWSFRPPEDVIIVPGHHEAIITKEMFDICQSKLDRNNLKKRGTFKTYKRKNVHVFAGLITCGLCGSQYSATVDRKRSDGWRPSVYLCSKRRKSDSCTNKFVSEITLGPFVLNYIANIVRAQASFGKSTSSAVLQKKLLRGPEFADIDHIEQPGLDAMREFFMSEKYGVSEFEPSEVQISTEATERDLLDKEKRRIERAITRLSQLYLYEDDPMPQTEYFIERKKLNDQLDQIDQRIQELDDQATADRNMSDADFIAKASYYALTQEILNSRHVDYIRMIKSTDPQITKEFVNSVCSNFCILDGKVTSIRFRNGIEHRFVYKQIEPAE